MSIGMCLNSILAAVPLSNKCKCNCVILGYVKLFVAVELIFLNICRVFVVLNLTVLVKCGIIGNPVIQKVNFLTKTPGVEQFSGTRQQQKPILL
jgi:hypothetical protein